MTTIHVAAAVIQDASGRILLTKRAQHLHQGGLWEFPGGKLEPSEDIEQALRREIMEELGLQLLEHRPLIRNLHHYPDKSILLDVHLVTDYLGVPEGLENQPLEWVEPANLSSYPMPQADIPVIKALGLPEHYLITGGDPMQRQQFLEQLEQALDSILRSVNGASMHHSLGLRLVQLRVGDLPEQTMLKLGVEAVNLCRSRGARLLLNGSPEMAQRIDADGVHLNSKRLQQLAKRPLPTDLLVAASCHNREELTHASALGLDFVVLSPVQETRSHPDASPLGWERFRDLVDEVAMPVYALGGMQQEDLPLAWQHGAQGIAGISCFWG